MLGGRVLISVCLFGILAYGQDSYKMSDSDDEFDLNDPNSDKKIGQFIHEGSTENVTFIPNESGQLQLSCSSSIEIKSLIVWRRNGNDVLQYTNSADTIFHAVHIVSNDDDALYECNGIKLWVLKKPKNRDNYETSVWRNSEVTCIDPTINEMNADYGSDLNIQTNGGFVTKVSAKIIRSAGSISYSTPHPIFPIQKTKIMSDVTMSCNNTDNWSFVAVSLPETKLVYEGKKVICRSTDTLGKCDLDIYFGDEIKASGKSPEVSYEYKRINIQKTRCESQCTIDGTTAVIPQKVKEINRGIFSAVIAIVIILIIIIIIVVLCCLWYRCGFKEKYGYNLNMRLNKSFNVDNKFSSYRLSGVEADGAEPESEDEEKGKNGEGSLIEDDSFVDPNFAHPNQNQDYYNKYDQTETQKPFLRI